MEGVTIQSIFNEFFRYLKNNEKYERTWARDDLKMEYNSFKTFMSMPMNFSTFLFKASRWKPRMLIVRRGTEVTFLQDIDQSERSGRESEVSGRRTRNDSQAGIMKTPFQNGHRRYRPRNTRRKKSSLTARSAVVSEGPSTVSRRTYSRPPIQAIAEPTVQAPKTRIYRPVVEIVNDTNARYQTFVTPVISKTRDSLTEKPRHDHNLRSGNADNERRATGIIPAKSTWASVKVSDARKNSERYDRGISNKNFFLQKKRFSAELNKPDVGSQMRKTIPGVRPKFLTGGQRTENKILPNYDIPFEIELDNRTGELFRNPQVLEQLSANNFQGKFHLLLYIEELQYRKEIDSYAMESATLKRNPRKTSLLYLEVPGLAENRPSLLIGDRVYAVRLDAKGNEYGDQYESFVHGVEMQQVGLGFNEKLNNVCQKNMKFSVRFTFNRRPLRLMHNALDSIPPVRLAEMFFPSKQPERYVPPKATLIMKKRDIESNNEQRTAVENIVLGKTPPIYIIFGPPGTGKTVTMVEAIYQTYKLYNFNILVCALCNDACDMLALKLRDYVDKSKMIRIYAASRSWKSVPAKIKEGKTNYNNGELYMPEEDELINYRIIVCTFVTAGRISLMKFPSGHFQRVFIDESGQAFEPECLIALSGILADEGKLVLAGDPKQLGPIVRSPFAMRHGLRMSLLQRLMDTCPLYQKNKRTGEYNPQCVTKLVRNYRSHEVILRISNEHFYDEELLVCADELKRNKMCGWEWLQNKKFPILFHGIEGKQTRDQSSPSYYNPDEVKIVKDYVDKLMESRGTHKMYKAGDIGIVSPYRKQCEKIRKAVERYPGIDVGSVEVFQGQERPVIIISTVRSSKEGLTDDAKYHLGFLCDPKRFNVAITRAQALLIIVGNPRLLCLDKYWKSLLEYCLKNNAYCGARFSSEHFRGASDMKEIEELFRKIDITSQEKSDIEDDMAAPFWRIEH